MYSGNKLESSMENTITVTPVKMEVDITHAYPTSSGTIGTTATSMRATNTSAASNSKEKPSKQTRAMVHKTPPTIDNFWTNINSDLQNVQQVDAKHQALPLARIKKIMKLDDNAKMIAAEAPLLFAKACEYFIQELTMRAWVHTEDNKRRTLQRSDIAQAIANYDQFDFLIDIVPREDIKPSSSSGSTTSVHNTKKETQTPAANTTASVSMPTTAIKMEPPQMLTYGTLTPEALAAAAQQQLQPTQQLQILQQASSQAQPQQLQYFITIPGQQHGQHQLVQQLQLQQPQLQQQLPNGLTLTTTAGNPQLTGLNIVAPQPQQLILTAGPNGQLTATPAPSAATTQHQQQTAILQNLAQQQQQQQLGNQQQIQLLHQVVSPTGELTNVPISITANQLNLLRLQMQQQQHQQAQQVIIPTHCVTTGAAQQMMQLGTAGNVTATSNGNSNATIQLGQVQIAHYPQQQQQHQQQQQQQHQQQQQQQHQQQQQNNSSAGTNIFLNTGQQQNSNSVVSTDRNLGSTYRTNC